MEELLMNIPPITRFIIVTSFSLSLLTHLELIHSYQLYFNFDLIIKKIQPYRIITSHLYLGDLTVNTCFRLILLYRFSCRLEDYTFRGNSVNYFFFIMMGVTLMSCFAVFSGMILLSESFQTMLLYLWSRRNKNAIVHILGLLPLPAPYLTWFFVVIQLIVGENIVGDLLGIMIGHIYYFFSDIYPQLPLSKDKRIFDPPPRFFISLCNFLKIRSNNVEQIFQDQNDQDEEQGDLPFGI